MNIKNVSDIAKGLDPSKALSTGFSAPKVREGPKADAITELFGLIALEWREFIVWLSDHDITRTKNMWSDGLDKYDKQTRMMALSRAIKTPEAVKSSRGPTLGEFLKLCRDQHRPELKGKQKLLPAPEPSVSVREKYMEILKNKDK